MNVQLSDTAAMLGQDEVDGVELPRLQKGQGVDLKKVRCRYERLYLCFVYVPSIILVLGVIALAFVDVSFFAIALGAFVFFYVIGWIAWKLSVALLLGNSISKSTVWSYKPQ
jgi:hypothetical protein